MRLWNYIVGRVPEVGSLWRDRYGVLHIVRQIGYSGDVYASLDNGNGPIPQPSEVYGRRDFHLYFREA